MHLRTLSVLGLSLIFASLTACGSNTTEEGNGGSGGSSNGGSNTGATGGSGTGATGGSGTGATGGSGTGATGGSGTGATGGSGTGATGGSGTGATGGSTGGSGTGATGGSGTGAVGGSGTGATGGSGGSSPCGDCLAANCAAEGDQCFNQNADCAAIFDCINAGNEQQTCLDSNPNGVDDYNALFGCADTNCPTECGTNTTFDCEPSGETPSGGACGAAFTCNPVTGEGCDVAAGEACDTDGNGGFQCYPPPNDAGICGACGDAVGSYCESGAICLDDGTGNLSCARYCCTSDDCGPSGTCAALFDDNQVGVCIVQ